MHWRRGRQGDGQLLHPRSLCPPAFTSPLTMHRRTYVDQAAFLCSEHFKEETDIFHLPSLAAVEPGSGAMRASTGLVPATPQDRQDLPMWCRGPGGCSEPVRLRSTSRGRHGLSLPDPQPHPEGLGGQRGSLAGPSNFGRRGRKSGDAGCPRAEAGRAPHLMRPGQREEKASSFQASTVQPVQDASGLRGGVSGLSGAQWSFPRSGGF